MTTLTETARGSKMITVAKITRACIRRYRDSGQVMAYVEWIDSRGGIGRTEGRVQQRAGDNSNQPAGLHMQSLFARAVREGLTVEAETW